MDRNLRKQQNLLVEAGAGVILFAIWSVAKTNLYLGLSGFLLEMVYEAAAETGINEKVFLVLMISLVVVILIWQMGIRLYIGLMATAEGKGDTKNWLYLMVAAVLLISDFHFFWEAFDIDRILSGELLEFNQITGLCMELASAYVLLELLISGVRVKMLRTKRKA